MPKSTQYLNTLNPGGDAAALANLDEGADWLFTFAPWNDEQSAAGVAVRDSLKEAYKTIIKNVQSGPMRTRAVNMLTDCRMLTNQAITFPGQ